MAKEKTEKPPKEKRPPKEKKPKKPKKPKKGQEQPELAQENLEGQEGQETQKGKKKPILLICAAVLLVAAAAIVVIFVILPMRDKDPDAEPSPSESENIVLYDLPETYLVGEEEVKAMEPTDPNGVQSKQSVRVSYTYTGLSNAGHEASVYVSSLVQDQKFSVVDAEFVRTKAPDFTTPEGTVLLAKNIQKPEPEAAQEGEDASASSSVSPSPVPTEEPKDMVVTMELAWTEGVLVITGDQAEGKVTSPPEEERPVTPGATMTMSEAVDYLYSLEPSVLGLSGDSMEDYRIYAMDGAVLVNNQPCMRLNVYSRDNPEHTNDVAGFYLLSRDGAHLYQLDEQAGKVVELERPAG